MSAPRYETNGTWYKGNTHIHSTASDGGRTCAELARMYADVGYAFLFCTDHYVASDVGSDTEDYPLLWLDGIELDGTDYGGSPYHVICLGTFAGITREMGLVAAMEAARAQGGLLILAHPHWTGNSLEDAMRWGFHGVEIYNHVCRWLNGKGDGAVYWNAMLQRFPDTLAFAVDDAHILPEHPGWNGGWIMVNATHCSREAILHAVRAGNFYSTCGPEFHAIEYRGTCVTVRTSPVQFVRLVGPAHLGDRVGSFEGELLTEVTLKVPADWPYAYLEVEDRQGRRAWTNTLFAREAI
jgi:predicted metal-dependent phosphoesterase TrpH